MNVGLRSPRERLLQTLAFEGLGLAVVAPLYAWATGSGGGESVMLLVALSVTVMTWAAVYNTIFDRLELRATGRVASDRPHGLRTLHAVGLEATAVLLTWPLVRALTGLGWWDALLADLGLTLAYMAWSYVFHLGFDRLLPVAAPGAQREVHGRRTECQPPAGLEPIPIGQGTLRSTTGLIFGR